jgi:hypothetical protein
LLQILTPQPGRSNEQPNVTPGTPFFYLFPLCRSLSNQTLQRADTVTHKGFAVAPDPCVVFLYFCAHKRHSNMLLDSHRGGVQALRSLMLYLPRLCSAAGTFSCSLPHGPRPLLSSTATTSRSALRRLCSPCTLQRPILSIEPNLSFI